MYKDYLDAIVRYYEERKSKSDLPQRLLQPRPSKIRDECVSVYRSRFVKKDLGIIRSFFEVYDETDLLKAIGNFDIDKFRPLVNYLRGQTITTDDKNIELLGWLLDFPQRPYNDRFDYAIEKAPSTEAGLKNGDEVFIAGANGASRDNSGSEQVNAPPGPESLKKDDNLKSRYEKAWRLVAAIVILLGTGAALYFSNKRNTTFGIIGPGQKECMVWVDDHYEQVSCDSPARVGLVLGLDKSSLDNLHRITRPDTITEKHIGKLWYKKRGNDSLDYYTAGGRDPIDPNRDLKRLTRYIFDKYLRKKTQ